MVTEDTKKVELLNACFVLVFADKTSILKSLTQQTREKKWWKEDFALVRKDWIRENLGKHDIHKSTGLDSQHPQVLRIHVLTMMKLLMAISERSWPLGEVPEDWKKASILPVFKRAGKAQGTAGH